MKNVLKLAVIGALLAVGVAANAATTNTVTNVEQTVTIALTGTVQDTAATNGTSATTKNGTIANKDIVAALSGLVVSVTTNNAGATNQTITTIKLPTFSKTAKLMTVNDAWVVRDVVSKKNVDTDVSAYFTMHQIAQVSKFTTNSKGDEIGTRMTLIEITFSNQTAATAATLTFDVTGVATSTIQTGAGSGTFAGKATVGGKQAIVKGTAAKGAEKDVKTVVVGG